MKCSEIRQQIIDGKESPEIRLHTAECESCARFLAGMKRIRETLAAQPFPEADEKLITATRNACRTELEKTKARGRQKHTSALPAGMWIALMAVTVLTFVWILTAFNYPQTAAEPNWQVFIAFVLVAQNLISLILSPVLLRGAIRPMIA